jgi:hypothetical protein
MRANACWSSVEEGSISEISVTDIRVANHLNCALYLLRLLGEIASINSDINKTSREVCRTLLLCRWNNSWLPIRYVTRGLGDLRVLLRLDCKKVFLLFPSALTNVTRLLFNFFLSWSDILMKTPGSCVRRRENIFIFSNLDRQPGGNWRKCKLCKLFKGWWKTASGISFVPQNSQLSRDICSIFGSSVALRINGCYSTCSLYQEIHSSMLCFPTMM